MKAWRNVRDAWRRRKVAAGATLCALAAAAAAFWALLPAQLFDAPFNTLHAEGLGGVFPNPHQLDEVVALVRGFGEPLQPPATS